MLGYEKILALLPLTTTFRRNQLFKNAITTSCCLLLSMLDANADFEGADSLLVNEPVVILLLNDILCSCCY